MTQPMDPDRNHLEALQDIRSMMERSSRFISLSGLSGVAAGICALIGAAATYVYLGIQPFNNRETYYELARSTEKWGMGYMQFFILDALLVLVAAISFGIFFTTRKARRNNQKIWDSTSRRLLFNLAVPLAAGGIFCLGLIKHGYFGLVAPSTLIFYGLALVNGSKYTLSDIRYLGYCEIGLGLLSIFFLGYGLEFWALGFGVMHIVYGTIMYFKYEAKTSKELG